MFFLLPHNFKRFADIIIVLIVFIVFGLFLLLICPFFLKFRAIYDKNLKRVFFAVNLDGFPIFGGYIERITDGFAIHLSAAKAVIVPYASLLGMPSNFSLRKDYFIRKVHILTEAGSEQAPQFPFMYAVAANIVSKIYGTTRETLGVPTAFKNDVLLYENENVFKISVAADVVFNLLTVFITLSKLLLRKIENGLRK